MSNAQAPILPLPEAEYLMVAFPGRVQNVEKALETLGGIGAIHKAHTEKEDFLPLNLRPNNPSSHNLFGDRIVTSNLLLRVRKYPTKMEHDIVGRITTTYAYQGLADFQYLTEKETYKNDAKIEPNKRPLKIPEAVVHTATPTIFSRTDYPLPYQFRHNQAFKPEATQEGIKWVSAKKKKSISTYLRISAKEEELPSKPPYSTQKAWVPLFERLQELFSQKPIWTKPSLLLNITPQMQKYLKVCLPCVAYFFSDGPWRLCWVKLGYDPRKQQSSNIYQSIEFRIPKQKQKVIDLNVKLSTRKMPLRFEQPMDLEAEIGLSKASQSSQPSQPKSMKPKPNTGVKNRILQLIDIQNENTKRILSEGASDYSFEGGWYKKETLRQVRRSIMARLDQILSKDPDAILDQPSISAIVSNAEPAVGSLQGDGLNDEHEDSLFEESEGEVSPERNDDKEDSSEAPSAESFEEESNEIASEGVSQDGEGDSENEESFQEDALEAAMMIVHAHTQQNEDSSDSFE